MATENKEPTAENTAETPQEAPEEGKAPACKGKCGSCRKGLAVIAGVVIIAAGAFAVPDVREAALAKYAELASPMPEETVEELSAVEPEPAEEDINIRLEQLENAREFENADTVVASIEPQAETDAQELDALKKNYSRLLKDVEDLRSQLLSSAADQNRRLNELKEAMPQKGLIEERLLALAAKEDGLVKQIAETDVKAERLEKSKADASSVLALMTRMDQTERKLKESSAEKEKAAATLLALYQLREAALSGQPFQTERQTVLALAASQPNLADKIQRLGFAADTGIWTMAALQESYEDFADKASLSARLSPKTDWFHKALNSLNELVVIRRIDAKGDDMSADAVLARAGQAVKKGDIQTAVIILKALNGEPAAEMKEWVTAAERYVLARQGINEAVSAALGVLYAKGE